jgi:hypothetical protein
MALAPEESFSGVFRQPVAQRRLLEFSLAAKDATVARLQKKISPLDAPGNEKQS